MIENIRSYFLSLLQGVYSKKAVRPHSRVPSKLWNVPGCLFILLAFTTTQMVYAQTGPGGVTTGLQLWLKANAGVTGTTAVTAWADQSGNSYNATATQGPELSTNSINFNPAMDFVSAGSEYLQITNGILGIATHNDAWVYTVSKTDLDQQQTIFFEDVSGANESFDVLTPWSNEETFFDFGYILGAGRINVAWGSNYGDYNMWTYGTSTGTATPNSTRKVIQRDGAIIASNNNNDNATGNNSNFYIGGGYRDGVGTTRSFDGEIAEVIVYLGVPSELEQEKVQSYLGVKYGITKNSADNGGTGGQDEQDYFASDGTVTWDYSANTTYHNDVAGIGRDDNSGLDQQKSTSINSDAIVIMDKTAAFGTDKDFLLWGNDNAATTTTTTGAHPDYDEIMSRIWKADLTGTPGNVTVQIIYPNDGLSGNYGLLADGNTDFTTGATAYGATSISGDTITFTNVSFTDGDFFTLGVTPSTPGGVSSNLQLWLKADKGVKNGASDATNGQAVNTWEDQTSARSNDATDATLPPPTFGDNTGDYVNFNPVVDFDGTNDGLDLGDDYIFSTGTGSQDGMTWFAIIEPDDPGVTKDVQFIFDLGHHAPASYGGIYGYEVARANALTSNAIGSHSNGTAPKLVRFTYDFGTDVTVNIDGEATASLTTATTVTELTATNINEAPTHGTNSGPFTIGHQSKTDQLSSQNGRRLDGSIAELIGYNADLSVANIGMIESYLAIKYGITLDNTGGGTNGDYIASDGTTLLWDASVNAAYHNNVTGIGRDDNSALSQKQSLSVNSDSIVTIGLDSDTDGLETSNVANTSTFSADKSFLIWGHDGASLGDSANNELELGLVSTRLNREWRVEETGTIGTVTVRFDVTTLPGVFAGTGTNNEAEIVLMVDNDGDFKTGSSLVYQSFVVAADGFVNFQVDLSDGQYFTLGSSELGSLPITLTAFNARATADNHVEVTWSTAQEINNAFFTIERSQEGIDFQTVGFKEGAGTSNTTRNYRYLDASPLDGVSYYRLKQTDFNGEFDYTEVSRVTLDLSQVDYKVIPNPVKRGENFKIDYPVAVEQQVRVLIFNSNGTTTFNKVTTVHPQENKIEVSTARMPKGLYLIRIIDPKLPGVGLRFIVK